VFGYFHLVRENPKKFFFYPQKLPRLPKETIDRYQMIDPNDVLIGTIDPISYILQHIFVRIGCRTMTTSGRSWSFSVSTRSEAKKDKAYERFNKWKDLQPGSPSSWVSLELLLDLAEQGIESLETRREPASVQSTIKKIDCNFLEFEEWDFKCFEKMDAKKKPDILGTDPDKVLIRCEKCKQGKAQAILQQYQKKLRGQNIRGILQMIRTFETFAEKGIPSTIYFCNRIKGRQVITGKKRIHCSKVNFEMVPIDPSCKNPRCSHFQEFTVKVEHEFPKETLALIEGIAEDYQRIEDLSPKPRKEVDVE
jgi:hypothetical protein